MKFIVMLERRIKLVQHGESVADYFKAAVEHTIELYRKRHMRYLQIVARKP